MQASYRDIAAGPESVRGLIDKLVNHPSIRGVTVALPTNDSTSLDAFLESAGAKVFRGDSYNVARRLIDAHKNASFKDQEFVVRICSSWQYIDLDLVDQMVKEYLINPVDYLVLPKDFDIVFAADIASIKALEKISFFSDKTPDTIRAKFCPWAWIETNPYDFKVVEFSAVPTYSIKKHPQKFISPKFYPENEFVGRDYAGSRYHFLGPFLDSDYRVLDIACGSGEGSFFLSTKCSWVLGVDYLDKYIEDARHNFPENSRLHFKQGNAVDFLYEAGNYFDLVVSLHTIEHLPDDKALLRTAYNNLQAKGKLILEAPLLAKRPLGRPINPYHNKEYLAEELEKMVTEQGFQIEKEFWECRGFYSQDRKLSRGALRIHAIKK
jgi:2-polyprenyl-3-methyl-5-hydroxy-6-metoxy-1,4-benzoquinol methylase